MAITQIGNVLGKVAAEIVKAPAKRSPLDRVRLVDQIQHYGFVREIAGDKDFNKAIDAISLAWVERRGVLICGENGVGKTRLLRAVYDTFHLRVSNPNRQPWEQPLYYHTDATWVDCNEPNHLQWLTGDDLLNDHIYLDDFGSERMLYGDVDAVGAFICRWYARHKDGVCFNMATNLEPEQVNDRSGGRVLDRLCEMCVFVRLDGTSKRKVIKIL